jgi:hypothetical protein
VTVRQHWSLFAMAPLQFAASRASGASMETLPYIPGTALRGALAAAFLAAHGADAPGFDQLANGTIFGHCYPVAASGMAAAVLPLSSVTCSHQPGFLADGGHGAGDLLLPGEAARLAAQGAATTGGDGDASHRSGPVDVDSLVLCPRCSADRRRQPTPGIQAFAGFCAWQGEGLSLVPLRYTTTVQRRAAERDRSRQPAVTVRQALAAGQRFAGTVTFPDAGSAEAAQQLCQTQGGRLWVGAGRSRGLGEVLLEAPAAAPESPLQRAAPLDDGIAARHAGLMTALGAWCTRAGTVLPDGLTYVTVTLRAGALVADQFGRWRQSLGGDLLSGWLGLPANSLVAGPSFVRYGPVDGWNAALGLPKPDALGIAAGSCWLFQLQASALPDVLAALERLEEAGIGERRQEGFGVIRGCDPLHWRVRELEQEQPA